MGERKKIRVFCRQSLICLTLSCSSTITLLQMHRRACSLEVLFNLSRGRQKRDSLQNFLLFFSLPFCKIEILKRKRFQEDSASCLCSTPQSLAVEINLSHCFQHVEEQTAYILEIHFFTINLLCKGKTKYHRSSIGQHKLTIIVITWLRDPEKLINDCKSYFSVPSS